jgi:hypothetical protein
MVMHLAMPRLGKRRASDTERSSAYYVADGQRNRAGGGDRVGQGQGGREGRPAPIGELRIELSVIRGPSLEERLTGRLRVPRLLRNM